jgi:hypothetical protein
LEFDCQYGTDDLFGEHIMKKWKATVSVRTAGGKLWGAIVDKSNVVIGIVSNGMRWPDWRFAEKFGLQRLNLLSFCQRFKFELLPT